jgi:peptidylprolyl isomerase
MVVAGALASFAMTYRLTFLTALAALSFLLVACGDSKRPAASVPTATATPEATATSPPVIEKVRANPTPMPEITPSGKDEPEIPVREGEPPAKLVVRDLEVGKGAEAARGMTLAVEYKGIRWDDGVVFDSTWDGGKPFQFIFGANQVIQGWEKGLEGMRAGGRRELVIPPDLAYGDHGQASIRPDETIVFVIDLLDVR